MVQNKRTYCENNLRLLAALLQLSGLGAANQSFSTVCDFYKVFLLEFSL